MDVKVGQKYRHVKSKTDYVIVTLGKFQAPDEYPELDLIDVVVYEALYGNNLSKIWVRPLSMFTEISEIDGVQRTKFELIEE